MLYLLFTLWFCVMLRRLFSLLYCLAVAVTDSVSLLAVGCGCLCLVVVYLCLFSRGCCISCLFCLVACAVVLFMVC